MSRNRQKVGFLDLDIIMLKNFRARVRQNKVTDSNIEARYSYYSLLQNINFERNFRGAELCQAAFV